MRPERSKNGDNKWRRTHQNAIGTFCSTQEKLSIYSGVVTSLRTGGCAKEHPSGRKIGLLVQHLLPKGSTQESERQFFLISDMAGRLLMEIGQLLEAAHGGSIPIVQPSQSSKKEDLYPEPYLFQWESSDEGR